MPALARDECGSHHRVSDTHRGGDASTARRREVDLYVDVEDVDGLFAALHDRVEVIHAPDDTDHGMREFIVRDPNGFWITFGQVRRDA